MQFLCTILICMSILIASRSANAACSSEQLNDGSVISFDNRTISKPQGNWSAVTATVSCFCPAGLSLVAGGCGKYDDEASTLKLLGSYPLSENGQPGWGCNVIIPHGNVFSGRIKVRVMCR